MTVPHSVALVVVAAAMSLGGAPAQAPGPTVQTHRAVRKAPSLTAAQRRDLTVLRARIGVEKTRKLERQARAVTGQLLAQVRKRRKINAKRPPRRIRRSMEAMIKAYAGATGERDANRAMAGIMMVAIASAEDDLRGLAAKVAANHNAKAELRESISALKDVIAEGEFPVTVEYAELIRHPDGTLEIRRVEEAFDETAAKAKLEELEEQLETLSDLSELDRMRLQQLYQNYNRALAILSAIMKSQHETLKSIIDNMRA